MRPFYIDTDPGCDDLVALCMALKSPEVDVKGISVVAGNTSLEFMAANILRVFGISKIQEKPPVYKGAEEPLLGRYRKIARCQYHGHDGMGDFPDVHPKRVDLEEAAKLFERDSDNNIITAAEAIIQKSFEYKNELEIVCLAPLTNLAIAYKLDNTLPSRIKKLHIMGGNHLSMGNDSYCAEFNFMADPEAAFLVLTSFNCLGLKLSIFTWESCFINRLGKYLLWENVEKKLDPEFTDFFTKILKPRFFKDNEEFAPMVSIPDTEKDHKPSGIICDAEAMSCFIDPSVITTAEVEFSACVELSGFLTRGQMIVHRSRCVMQPNDKQAAKDLKPITIIHQCDIEKMAKLVETCFTECPKHT